ncbi:MAG TPA: hypothetical protein VMI35_08590, partial [Puia sp.]|nr:hypothetical protein [Puia sp.]
MTDHTRCHPKMIALLLLHLGIGASVFGQEETLSWLRQKLDHYGQQVLQEKVYVHTDRSYYVAGEILWFKVYDVDASLHKPLGLSKIAYVELLAADQKPVLQGKIALSRGSGKGSFLLPAGLASGNYLLRAYTSWMKNFSADFFFEKNISVVNSLKTEVSTVAVATGINEAYDIHFFPEGGNLVNGLESKVGFRAVDKTGKSIDFSGTLIDENNQTVASFRPQLFGMGHFFFTPANGHNYKALIRIGNNNVVVSAFPAAFDVGYVMRVTDNGNGQLIVAVRSNKGHSDLPVYLLVHSRQVITTAAVGQMEQGRTQFRIDKQQLGEGISQLTIFDATRRPVCERLYFKRPHALEVEAASGQDQFSTRKKVTVNLDISDHGKPVEADLSMAVYRIDSLEPLPQQDIVSYFWLSSDIQGKVESPGYYFAHSDPATDSAADNLMLTQGWRRFRWEDVLQDKKPSFDFLPEYEGHIITGRVIDKRTGRPVDSAMAYLTVPGYQFELGTSFSNKSGQLQFDIKNFVGRNEIVVQTDTRKDSNYRVDILSPFSDKYSSGQPGEINLMEDMREDLVTRSVSMQVQRAFLTDSLQKFRPFRMQDSTAFYGTPDRKYFLDEYTRFTTMEEVMREYVAGVSLHKRQQKFYFRILDEPYRLFF